MLVSELHIGHLMLQNPCHTAECQRRSNLRKKRGHSSYNGKLTVLGTCTAWLLIEYKGQSDHSTEWSVAGLWWFCLFGFFSSKCEPPGQKMFNLTLAKALTQDHCFWWPLKAPTTNLELEGVFCFLEALGKNSTKWRILGRKKGPLERKQPLGGLEALKQRERRCNKHLLLALDY